MAVILLGACKPPLPRANLYDFVLFIHHRTLCDGGFTHTNMSIIVKQIYRIFVLFLHHHTVGDRVRKGTILDSTPTWLLQVAYWCADYTITTHKQRT